jgi:hypothetical protein
LLFYVLQDISRCQQRHYNFNPIQPMLNGFRQIRGTPIEYSFLVFFIADDDCSQEGISRTSSTNCLCCVSLAKVLRELPLVRRRAKRMGLVSFLLGFSF